MTYNYSMYISIANILNICPMLFGHQEHVVRIRNYFIMTQTIYSKTVT
jgi:hypothetical protein